MSISKASKTSSYANLLRSALAVTVLMTGVAVVQAADPVPPESQPATNVHSSSNKNINNNESSFDTENTKNKGNMNGEKPVSDGWITTKVKSELLANSASKGLKVHVTTKGGVVSLKGNLPTQDAADLVKTIAQNVKGVQSVDVSGLAVQG